MAHNCMAGMCRTPSLEANHVVPQKKHTHAKASIAFCWVVLDDSILFLLPAGGGIGGFNV